MREKLLQDLIESDEILEPETLRQLYPDLSEEDFNKTMAVRLLKHTRHFWENFYAFEDITLAVNDVVPDFSKLQGVTPEQIWYAITLASKLHPELEYAKEVQLYAKFMCNEAGVYIYPLQLGLENPYLDAAKTLAKNGPFPLGDSTTEEIQAEKYLIIQEYLKERI